MPYRFAGEQLNALRRHMDGRGMASPAFVVSDDGSFELSTDSQRVLGELKRLSGREIAIRPANSIEALDGVPLWGSGSGFVNHEPGKIGDTGVVDPFASSSHVVAHEGAHASLPSDLQLQGIVGGRRPLPTDPLKVPRDTGARLRYVQNEISTPSMVEEARAQGVAEGVLHKLGLPGDRAYQDPRDYPLGYVDKGLELYVKNEVGPPSPAERETWDRIQRNAPELVNRVYQQAYQQGAGL